MNKLEILNKILPDKIKAIRRPYRGPFIDLSEKHIQDCEVIEDRNELLRKLPKEGDVAELGVAEGDYSAKILEQNRPSKLFLIDTWSTGKYNEEMYQKVKERFSKQINKETVDILRKDSVKALDEMEENSLDWVYIDTIHSYERLKRELKAAARVVKEDGFISGHDYMNNCGTIPAVHEFCQESNWKLRYLTIERSKSFALSRMNV